MTHLNGTTWATFRTHLHRGGAYGYWWTLDEVKTYEINRGQRKGQHEKCKRTYWWPVGKPSPLPSGATEHVYFGVHPAIGIPQERTGRDGVYVPKRLSVTSDDAGKGIPTRYNSRFDNLFCCGNLLECLLLSFYLTCPAFIWTRS